MANLVRSLMLLLALVGIASAESQDSEQTSTPPNCSPLSLTAARLEARKLLDVAEQAQGRKNKVRALEAAYRLYQTPVILYNLGMLWHAAGQRIEAADLLRRYLYEADRGVSEERRDRLSRLLARISGGSGELELSSEPCAFVYVDGRLVGRTPLSLPLLLRVGEHVIEVEKGHRKRRVELSVGPGQRALSIRLPATAVLVSEGVPEPVAAAAEGAIAEAGLTPIGAKAKEVILASAPALRGCLGTLPCQEELARLLSAQYVLHLLLQPDEGLAMRLLDADVGAWSVAREASCSSCGPEQLAPRALELARQVLREGLAQAKGTLQVTSVPEADVVVDGRKVGRTPLLRSALAGPHTVTLLAPGYLPHHSRVEVENGRRVTVDAALKVDIGPPPPAPALPPAPPPAAVVSKPAAEPVRRPRWRLALGGVGIGVGAGLLTLGALALAVNGQCGPAGVPPMPMPGAPCERVYDTLAPGGGMLGAGGTLLVAGALTIVWPGR